VVHLAEDLLEPLLGGDQEQRDGDVGLPASMSLIRSSPEQIEVVLSISNAANDRVAVQPEHVD